MKKLLALVATIFAVNFAAHAQAPASGNWKIDPAHTKVKFTTRYLVISDVDGEFKKFDGTVNSVKPDWTDLQVAFNIDVASVSTDNEMRDKHLKSDDFFNAEKFPLLTFKSKSIKSVGKGKYILSGDLTIRDVTKNIDLAVMYNGTVKDPWGNTKAGFKLSGNINRKEFNLKYSNAAAAGEAVVGDIIEMMCDVVLIKQLAD